MKTRYLLTAILFAVFALNVNAQDHQHKMMNKYDKNGDGKVFQCSMCPDQISDEAGKCEKCEMKLKEVSVKDMKMNKMKKDKKSCSSGCCSSAEVKSEAKIWNAYCPVRGGEVDTETPTVDYKGKKIGFCCPGCDTKFNKDPEKYMKNLSKDGKEFIKKKS